MTLQFTSTRRANPRKSSRHLRNRPSLEFLEQRLVMSSFTVTDTSDSLTDTGSLRYAVAEADAASGASTIKFNLTTPATITLSNGDLELSNTAAKSIKIVGPGASQLTINGNAASRIFLIDSGVSATISGLTLSNGSDPTSGGAIQNAGTLALNNLTIAGSSAPLGGGLENTGTATLKNCNVSDDQAGTSGGGIESDGLSASLALVNCTISGNTSPLGGAIHNQYGTLTASGTTVSGNAGGSAIESYGGSYQDPGQGGATTLTGCTISGTTTDGVSFGGIGLFGFHAELTTVSGCTITGNAAQGISCIGVVGTTDVANLSLTGTTIEDNASNDLYGDGAGVELIGSGTLIDCTISGNGDQSSVFGFGGGVLVLSPSKLSPTTTIEDCNVSGNASAYGGGVFAWNGTLNMTGCTISDNSAIDYGYGQGGGFENFYANSTLTDCTIVGNTAGAFGAGLCDQGGKLAVVACTVTGNTSGTEGGAGLYIYGGYKTPETTLTDTIIAGNTNSAGQPDEIDGYHAANVTGSYNLIGPGGSGSLTAANHNQLNVKDPGLTAPGDYGGPTETVALQPGSPALGAGIAVSGVTTDQRGFPLDTHPDIGAFQTQPGPLVVDTAIDGIGSALGQLSLRQAVNLANVLDGGDAITFDKSVFAKAKTITLTDGPLEISNTTGPISIKGTTAAKLTISGGEASGVFQVDKGAIATLSGMTITGGVASGNGGGLLNAGTTTLANVVIAGDTAFGDGGGVYNSGSLFASNTTIAGDLATNGGGLDNAGTAVILGSSIDGNFASIDGGGIDNSGFLSLGASDLSANFASLDGGGLYDIGTATLFFSTVDSNAASSGGGIFVDPSTTPAVLVGTIVAKNQGGNIVGKVIKL